MNTIVAQNNAKDYMEPGFDTTGPWLMQRMLYQSLSDSVTALWGGNMVSPDVATGLAAYIDTTTDSLMLDFATTVYDELIAGGPGAVPADSSALLDTALANFFTAAQTSDFNAMQAYENQLQTAGGIAWGIAGAAGPIEDTIDYDNALATAVALNAAIPDSNTQAVNYKTIQNIYLNTIARVDTFVMDSVTLASVGNIAAQCPYVAGDAVYFARSLYAQYVDSIFFDDLVTCPPGDTTEKSMHNSVRQRTNAQETDATKSSSLTLNEFVKVYPNPAKNLINLAYNAQTTGLVYFELSDALGQTVMIERLGDKQNFAQYETGSLSNRLYYWRLRDSIRTIKAGKVVIMK